MTLPINQDSLLPADANKSRHQSKRNSGFRVRRFVALSLLSFVAMACFHGQSVFAKQQKLQPNQSANGLNSQFLILKTGSVYEGQLEFSGDKYIVHRPTGATIKFTAGEVDFFADSLDEAYTQLALRITSNDLLAHQRLTNWTLKNRLTDRARQQVDVLRLLAPKSSMTRLAERQLASLRNPHTTSSTDANPQRVDNSIRELPKAKGALASNAELTRTIESFNESILRNFNRAIHPKIVNGCAAARCHGNQDSPMRLWRVNNRGGTNSTGVRRNLHAITKFLDRENPADSELLSYVSKVHGGMKAPAYDENSFHYYAIRNWVMSTGNVQISNGGRISDVSQTSFINKSEKNEADLGPNGSDGIRNAGTDVQKEWPTLPGFESDLPSPVDLNHRENRFVPKDEFDPEIFNRRFAVDRITARTAISPSQSVAIQPTVKLPFSTPKPPIPQPAEKQATLSNSADKVNRIKSLPPIDSNGSR